jgi:hypothetical protein
MAVNPYGTSEECIKSLRAVESSSRMKILRAHFRAPGHSATARQLAREVGYENFNAINLQYGALAEAIASGLGVKSQPVPEGTSVGFWLWALVEWDGKDAEGEQPFKLRPEVVEALRRMGW